MKLKCFKCGREWNSASLAVAVSCPSCGSRIKTGRKLYGEEVKQN